MIGLLILITYAFDVSIVRGELKIQKTLLTAVWSQILIYSFR